MAKKAILQDGAEALQILINEIRDNRMPGIVEDLTNQVHTSLETKFNAQATELGEAVDEVKAEMTDLLTLRDQVKSLQGSVSYLKGENKKLKQQLSTGVPSDSEGPGVDEVLSKFDMRITQLEALAATIQSLLGSGAVQQEGQAPLGPLTEVYARMDRIVAYVDAVDEEQEERWNKIRRVANRYRISS